MDRNGISKREIGDPDKGRHYHICIWLENGRFESELRKTKLNMGEENSLESKIKGRKTGSFDHR